MQHKLLKKYLQPIKFLAMHKVDRNTTAAGKMKTSNKNAANSSTICRILLIYLPLFSMVSQSMHSRIIITLDRELIIKINLEIYMKGQDVRIGEICSSSNSNNENKIQLVSACSIYHLCWYYSHLWYLYSRMLGTINRCIRWEGIAHTK